MTSTPPSLTYNLKSPATAEPSSSLRTDFITFSVPVFILLVKVQVTSNPGVNVIVAFLFPKSTTPPVEHTIESKSQPDISSSVIVNVPGIKLLNTLVFDNVASVSSSREKFDIPVPVVVNAKS